MKKLDCHTHIINESIRSEYFSRVDCTAIVMQLPESIMPNPDTISTVMSDKRLFLCPCIDMKTNVPDPGSGDALSARLCEIEENLDKWKVVGLKLYTSYQSGHADDERLFPVYEFAEKHRLAVVFHTGLVSLVLPSDDDFEGSGMPHIARAAERFPNVNFVAAHMDDPHFDRCIDLLAVHPNTYTDISGAYESGTDFASDIDAAIALFKKATDRFPNCAEQMLYGTDFCPPLNMSELSEYDLSLERMFSENVHEKILYKNALRVFPRLADYLHNGDFQ